MSPSPAPKTFLPKRCLFSCRCLTGSKQVESYVSELQELHGSFEQLRTKEAPEVLFEASMAMDKMDLWVILLDDIYTNVSLFSRV